jgi:hypothetical protein
MARECAVALSVAAIALSALASSADAARPPPGKLPLAVTSEHFAVHYTDAAGNPDAVSVAQAAGASAIAESAYGTFAGSLGYPPPIDDGNGTVDIYVMALTNAGGDIAGVAAPDNTTTPTSSGYIRIPPASVGNATVISHELFHVFQYAIRTGEPKFLSEGTAEWAAYRATGQIGAGDLSAYPNELPTTLNCAGSTNPRCPYRRWVFWNYLATRFGDDIVREVYQRVAAMGTKTDDGVLQAIDQATAGRGSSLPGAFGDFVVGALPFVTKPAASIVTPGSPAVMQPAKLVADHLAADVVDIRSLKTNCGKRLLRVAIAIPPGGRAALRIGGSGPPIPVTGSTTLPWDTCSGQFARLALVNPSSTADDQTFVVRVLLRPVVPKLVISVPSKAKLKRKKPRLRFVVTSNAKTTLIATLKSPKIVKRFRLKVGRNELSLALPKGYSKGSKTLTLEVSGRPAVKRGVKLSYK